MTETPGAQSRSSQTPRPDDAQPLRFRAALDGLPAYVAGKASSGPPGAPAYKLSSNENPYPPLPGVLEAATAAVATMNRYPDMGCSALLEALSARFGVEVGRIAVGAGSVAVLYHLLQAVCEPGDEVVYAWRSFEAYPIAVQVTGASGVAVPVTADGRHDLDAMSKAVGDRTRAVLVCSPNNPTGPAVRREELVRFVDAVPPQVLVVVDEAYREFVSDPDVPDALHLLGDRPNVVVLRTFSKAYGLAAFRVGFAIAAEPVATAIRKCGLPFSVSHVAQQAAVASLAVEKDLLERVDALVAERARVRTALLDAGWDVPDTQANFVWLPLGADAVAFASALQLRGVMVRPFAGDGVRVTVGEIEANDIFLSLASSWPTDHQS